MFDKVKKFAKKAVNVTVDVCKKAKDKALALVGLGVASYGTVASQAAISYNKASGEFEGSVDLGAYYSGVEITVAVIGVTLGIALFIGMIKKARG